MSDDGRGYDRPVEEVARAIYEHRNGTGCMPWSRRDAAHRRPYLADAVAAIDRLRKLGFINDIGLRAIKAERAKE